jgi:type VI secretion system protein ImpL
VNTTRKYWIITFAFLAWLVLAWVAGTWMNLQGKDLWTLRGTLFLIGMAGFVTAIWWFRSEEAEEAAAGSDEIDILMRKAQARLRTARGGKAALGDVPVVLVLGESGSAKTSVVLHSGLEPQLLAGHTVQDETPIPTRALNLWLSSPFVVAETGGPLLHEPPRWAHLIKKLVPGGLRFRGEGAGRPRAALVCIDCEKFLTPGVGGTLSASIEQIRARLRETATLLGINLPVYVLFTRADRLQFFQDYVSPLSTEEAARSFGAALPIAAYTAGSYAEVESEAVSAAFDSLFYSMADCRLDLLTRKPETTQASPVYEFPREFKKLRPILVPLLVDICRPGPARTTPFLRGFYFTGVRPLLVSAPRPAAEQEEPLAAAAASFSATRMMDIKKAVAVARQLAAQDAVETRRIPQWVFLPQFFKDVLFNDKTALGTSTFSTIADQRKRFALTAAMGIVLFLMVGFTASSIRNKKLENEVIAAAQDVADVHMVGRQPPSLDDLNKLETLRQSVEALATDRRRGPPLSMRWGLYVGNSLLPDARAIYFRKFQELLLQPAQAVLLQTLNSLPAAPGANDRYDPVFEALKAYLLTTSDAAKSDREFLPSILLRSWVGSRDIDSARLHLAGGQFNFFAGELKNGNPFSTEVDSRAVARARRYLAQFPGAERVYRLVVADADKANPAVDFNRKFPNSADIITAQADVSGAFTKSGWSFMQGVWDNPSPYFNAESWVLGEETVSPGDLAKRTEDLQHRYVQDYIERWHSFLRGASVNRPVSLGSTSQELQKLAGDQSPLLALLCVAAQNTAIDQPDVARAFQAVQAVTPHDCQEQNLTASTTAYVRSLSDLQACVDRADNSSSDQKDAAKAQCLSDVTQAEEAAKQIADGFQPDPDAHADQTVKDLLLAPINTAAALLRPGPVSAVALCERMGALGNEYPFNPPATNEAPLQEIGAVFAPQKGALSQFYASALKNLLVRQGMAYVPNPSSPQAVNPQFLSFFNHAMDVQRALYTGGAGQLQFPYALRPLPTENVSSMALSIDGKSLNFSGGTAPFTPLNWPGTSGQGVRLTVKIPGGVELGFPNYDGVWGVFHFFADATVLQRRGNLYTLQWVLGGDRPVTAPNGNPVTVQLELDTMGGLPIMERGFLSSVHCVPLVTR